MAGHAVVVPYPARGHINPMMQFATKLASRGVSLTFVLTQTWHQIITQADDHFFSRSQKLGLDIRAGIIQDCVVGESERSINMTAFVLSLSNMESHVAHLISDLNRSGSPPSCLVADTLLIGSQGYIGDIPGLSHLQWTEFVDGLPPPSPASKAIVQCFINVRDADWIVANSFNALENRAVDALRNKIPVQCVGPLNMPFTGCGDSQCSRWLDSKPARSVIYVSFGSFVNVGRAQVGEIAAGLMQSGYSFVWALRPDAEASHVSEMLPSGFMEECKDRGLIEPWLHQEGILSHPSIGGFFSHCGWNAVLESVSAGVPILGFPVGMDQFINCKLAVEEWKFGVRGRSKEDENRVIGAEEIAGKVKVLMEGEESKRLRGAVERFREVAREEVVNGMSANTLKLLADRLKSGKQAGKK